MTLPNEVLLPRVAKAVAEGSVVTIPVKGHSMFPFILGNQDCIELHSPTALKVGDVVLAEIAPKQYILHRIYRFCGEREVVLMGDGNVRQTERCFIEDIKAKGTVVISKSGKRKPLDSVTMRFLARVWKICLPVRSLLLRILWFIMF